MSKIEKVVEKLVERTRNGEIDWSSDRPYSAQVEGKLVSVYTTTEDRLQLISIQNGKKHTKRLFPDNLSVLTDAIEEYHTPEEDWEEDWINQVLSDHDE